MKFYGILFSAVLIAVTNGDVSHLSHDEYSTTTVNYPPRPYEFGYSAGRFPGHVDRTHVEVGDGAGTVKGAFSYVDPKQQVRVVEYVADEYGFYPKLSHELKAPEDTVAVKLAADRHHQLYSKIAESHANPHLPTAGPKKSAAVERAEQKHLDLFAKIAAEHAKLGAEREAERLAFEATSIRNEHEEY
ncbi:larval cuticle protein LCP-17 [Culicoides brevitarsis]|uniref:larval cuticle protein LCP-17 n=1 Tax=Culicoides brevitarsis TaxID=469753 RepID=UPI00307C58FB